MVKIGDILIHPQHGEMTVTAVGSSQYDEYISSDIGFQSGVKIEAEFDKYIPAVRWRVQRGPALVSKLIFHSYWLRNLTVKGAGGDVLSE